MALPKVGQGPKTGEYGVDAFRTTTKRRDRKSTRLNSSPQSNLVCRLLLEKKNNDLAYTESLYLHINALVRYSAPPLALDHRLDHPLHPHFDIYTAELPARGPLIPLFVQFTRLMTRSTVVPYTSAR